MAKLPKYMRIVKGTNPSKICVVIKWWGMPIILFKAMASVTEYPWYRWLSYPKLCIKAMRGGLNEY